MPVELKMALQVEQWGADAVLGNEGLDYKMLSRMQTLLNVYRAVQAYRGAEGGAIHKVFAQNPKLYAWLDNQGWL
jgi:hypothetical protein